MGLGRMTINQSLTKTFTNQTTSWLMHNCNTFGDKTNHGQTRTHKTHHSPYLGEATTFLLVVYYAGGHKTKIQMAFVLGLPNVSPEIPKVGSPSTLGAHNFVYRPPIKMRPKTKL
jgi:hypothetical protein